jgi:hypothetical protein
MPNRPWPLSLLLLLALAAGCAPKPESAAPGKGRAFLLNLKLEIDPSSVTIDEMYERTGFRPQQDSIKFTFTVTNERKVDYLGEWPDSSVATFWVTEGSNEVWRCVEPVSKLPTTINLKTGDSVTYRCTWNIADTKTLRGKTLTAHASFQPEQLVSSKPLPVKATKAPAPTPPE